MSKLGKIWALRAKYERRKGWRGTSEEEAGGWCSCVADNEERVGARCDELMYGCHRSRTDAKRARQEVRWVGGTDNVAGGEQRFIRT